MDPKALAALERRNAERYEFLCTCQDEEQLFMLGERLGDRDELNAFIDALIAERKEAA